MRVPVLIAGGGLVGLTASLLLSQQGIDSLLVERHTGTSPQPKARRFNTRTMEAYRSLGIAADIEKAAADLDHHQAMRAGPTLADSTQLPGAPPGEVADLVAASPVLPCLCAQDRLEPVLRDLAVARGGDVRFATELLSFTQDASGIRAVVAGRDGGAEFAGRASGADTLDGSGGAEGADGEGRYEVSADFLIAADGARSTVREALGIPRAGRGTMGRAVTVYFRADLADIVRGREFNLCQIDDAEVPGAFASVNGTDLWLFYAGDVDIPAADWPRHLSRLIGAGATQVEVLSVQSWEPSMRVAERFQEGRVFLAGDAAHVMPPFAAQGANTGIQDVHNLAWKLACVLKGQAGPSLLDSYHTERHPTAYFAAEQSSLRTGDLRAPAGFGRERPELAHPFVIMLGYSYAEGALVADGGPPAPTDRLELSGRPGSRVPHAWVSPGVSTVDLCGPGFALFTDAEGDDWCAAARAVGWLPAYQLGREWTVRAGLEPGGALLVRPDAVVAWRSDRPTPAPATTPGPAITHRAALDAALAAVLPRPH